VLSQVLPTSAADHGAPLCRDEPHVLLTASVLNAPSDTALQRVSVPLWSAAGLSKQVAASPLLLLLLLSLVLVFPSADELTKQALSLSVAKKDLMLCKDGPQAGRVTVIMLAAVA
jgi:hypothetical protein